MMKRFLLTAVLGLAANVLIAQPLFPPTNGKPVKFVDVLERYKERVEAHEEFEVKKRGKVVEEDEHYHLGRWEWYWSQHCDDNGNIISPKQTQDEWLKYMVDHKGGSYKTTAIPSNWIFQGPTHSEGGYSGLGRINVVAFDPVDSNTIYIGSAAGSTWKTTDGGNTWASLYDFLPTLGVADIKVNPLNRNTIFVATGDGDAGDAYSSGVIKSYDGGATWLTTGLTWPVTAYNMAKSLLINPADTNKMILASDAGIFKTANAGVTWTQPSTLNFKQILYKPGDTGTVYGTIYTDSSAQLMRSVNGGVTWIAASGFNDAQRINIAVSPANPAIVYAIASSEASGLKGIYKSVNSGASYSPVFINDTSCVNNLLSYDHGLPSSDCGGQGWYDLCIAVDPLNADKLVIGGINNYYSANGGLTWSLATRWWGESATVQTVHADKHWLAYNPLNHAVYLGCDGGIYRTHSPIGGEWKDITNGIGITQFYRNAVANGATFVLGGSQDNGTKKIDGATSDDMTGGDGMQCLFNYSDPENVFYCAYQNGHVDKTTDGGSSFGSITDDLPTPGAWITPYVLHPTEPDLLFIGYKQVFLSNDNGGSWTPISPVFDTNYNIGLMAIANSDPNYIYTIYNDYDVWKSVIHYTADMGTTWNDIALPFSNFITDIAVDPRNANRFWVTLGGYSGVKVYRHDVTTGAWAVETGGLPSIPANCILIDTFSLTKYVGTDAAVFYKDTTMTTWALYNNHLPTVHVYDLNINYTTGELWAATYGRGMWKSIKAEQVNGIAIHPSVADVLTVAPNPARGSFIVSSTGISFRNAAVTVRLVTTDGKTAQTTTGTFDSSGNLKVTTGDLAPGFYICEVSNRQGIARGRVVVY
ncbi:MAG: hypothetical protein V4649_10015 [Bacteroidota bacterium]